MSLEDRCLWLCEFDEEECRRSPARVPAGGPVLLLGTSGAFGVAAKGAASASAEPSPAAVRDAWRFVPWACWHVAGRGVPMTR